MEKMIESATKHWSSIHCFSDALDQSNKHVNTQIELLYSVGELDKFNIIHVTGTKGKVDQRAFAERILRNSGFRTGFYSSPHLVHVRERICINGWPISRQLFTKYFWEAYEQLDDSKAAHGGSMPFYFQFLTMLAFHVFLHKLVDLAGIEVGIGGEYDCTNIIRKPWVCGVTSLDFDHCNLLSDTMEKIAWQKAGIFKPGVPAFTVSQQLGALKVLQDRAEGIGCPLSVCPELDHYEALVGPLSLGLVEDRKRFNASLALQLSNSWLQHTLTDVASCRWRPLFPNIRLQQTEWLGRNQTLRRGSLTYYVDGAHTSASMKACVCWFRDQTNASSFTLLILFLLSGPLCSVSLFKYVCACGCVCLCASPLQLSTASVCNALSQCTENQSIWLNLNASQSIHEHHRHLVISSALRWIRWVEQPSVACTGMRRFSRVCPQSTEHYDGLRGAGQISVLVTGSLYLVGGALKHLDPSLESQGHNSVNL
uniref:tetrahydrofolate synthase n=1 Tax=Sphaeramia orbicularis TaxID=375764 RepID=A0A673BTC8_9TELE